MSGSKNIALSFPTEKEYVRCVAALDRTGILTPLPISECQGVIGMEGKEYPLPTLHQVAELISDNDELVGRKVSQGFDRLELVPMAMPLPLLIERLHSTILKHAAKGEIYQTRSSPSDPVVPVRVNSEKQIWIWDTLRAVLENEELVYFPQDFSNNHRGQTKSEVIDNGRICAIPGWSVGLVENLPVQVHQDQGAIISGRKQLEIGLSPRDYLMTLQTEAYQGETGKTLEDFITKFLTHLEMTNEVSYDRHDNNALWLLGQYVKYVERVRSDLVPTGWWHRDFGRVRLDAHRPGNRLCTRSWGGSSTVRLPKP